MTERSEGKSFRGVSRGWNPLVKPALYRCYTVSAPLIAGGGARGREQASETTAGAPAGRQPDERTAQADKGRPSRLRPANSREHKTHGCDLCEPEAGRPGRPAEPRKRHAAALKRHHMMHIMKMNLKLRQKHIMRMHQGGWVGNRT